jgi:hypothetical protein
LLDLLERIQPAGQKSLLLDSIHFKQGQPVRLTGKAKKDQHYIYMKTLQQTRGLSQVRLENPVYDKKAKATAFSLTLHYKHWSRKRRAALATE